MSFQEQFQILLQPLLVMKEDDEEAGEEEVNGNYLNTWQVVMELTENQPSIAENPIEFFDKLEELSSSDGAHYENFQSQLLPFLRNVIALAKDISVEVWEIDPAAGDTFFLHVLEGEYAIGTLTAADGTSRTGHFLNDPNDSRKSFAYLDFRETTEVSSEHWGANGEDIIQAQTVLKLMGNLDQISGKSLLVSSSEDIENALAQFKYHLVLDGLCWTQPVELPAAVKIATKQIKTSVGGPESTLVQFTEPFSMLSDINARRGILEVFLSTYHVLENYMIRKVIAKNLRSNNGNGFQRVRDFKRLGNETDASEVGHLDGLFASCWNEAVSGSTLSATLWTTLANLKSSEGFDAVLFDEFLELLEVKGSKNRLKTLANGFHTRDAAMKTFPILVYKIRCSIVHNKATEFHLSNEELILNSAWQKNIGEFCLPVMLRLAYGFPSVPGARNPIRYDQREFSLY